jgi:hypothetical protein
MELAARRTVTSISCGLAGELVLTAPEVDMFNVPIVPESTWQALGVPIPRDPELAAKVLSRCEVQPNGCWLFQGPRLPPWGYGRLDHQGEKTYAHRLAFRAWYGPVPEGLECDHVKARGCTSTACASPLHLEAVQHRVNVLRSDCPAAVNARKTHCIRGHQFTPENTYRRPDDGSRTCRTCDRLWQQERAARKRSQALVLREAA